MRGSPYWCPFQNCRCQKCTFIFVNTALSMHRREKKNPFLTRYIYLYRLKKQIPKTTQYPAKPDLSTSFGKGEFDLVPSKLNYLQCNWEICKVNVIYTKAANFPFISTEILSESFIFKQELNIWSLQSESDTWLNNISCLHSHFYMLVSKRSFIFTICLNYMQVTDFKSRLALTFWPWMLTDLEKCCEFPNIFTP